MSSFSPQRNAELQSIAQTCGDNPLADRATDLYRREFVVGFVEKWDELIDWDARAKSEGQFFIDVLRAHGKESVLDVASGNGGRWMAESSSAALSSPGGEPSSGDSSGGDAGGSE
jgi:glycine/sarcosine/dimethylglycine N-methyltransferase